MQRITGVLKYLIDLLHQSPYRHPWKLILCAGLLSLLGGYVYYFSLPIISDREKLVDQNDFYNRLNLEFQQEFGTHMDRLILVVTSNKEHHSAEHRRTMKAVAHEWSQRLRKRPDLFSDVIEKINWNGSKASPLYYLPFDDFKMIATTAEKSVPLAKDFAKTPTLGGLFGSINKAFNEFQLEESTAEKKTQEMIIPMIKDLFQNINHRIKQVDTITPGFSFANLTKKKYTGSWDPDGYLFTQNNLMLTVFALPVRDTGEQNRYERSLDYARESLQHAMASHALPGIDTGLAGLPALEEDEMSTAQRDFGRSGLLTLFFVSIIFMLGFRNISRPFMAAICLSLSIAITFLMIWLVIGHLNYLATIFAVILVALGIDFAIHFFTHYQHSIVSGTTPTAAIRITQKSIGGALWLSGVTTAVAFLSIIFTDFPGLQDLGLIASMGLIVSLLCMYTVFPAMLYLLDNRKNAIANSTPAAITGFDVIWTWITNIRGGLWIGVIIALLSAAGFVKGQYEVNTNLLDLQAKQGSANVWQRKLLKVDDRASFVIASFDNRQALESAQAHLRNQPNIIRASQSLFPEREQEKRQLANNLCKSISKIEVNGVAPNSEDDTRLNLFRLRQTVRKYQMLNVDAEAALEPLSAELDKLQQLFSSLTADVLSQRVQLLNASISKILPSLLMGMNELFCPLPFKDNHAPKILQKQFLSDSGKLALIIYPMKNSWEKQNQAEFVESVRKEIPHAFGGVATIYDNAITIIKSFKQAAIYSLIAVFVMLLFLTGSLRDSLLASLPLVSSLGLLLLLMQYLPDPIEWNFANLFALPILIGIGVDGGVHLVRAHRQSDPSIYLGAIKAVTFSSLTTATGFGILATGEYQGGASLGTVLFIGISMNLFVCLFVLSPMLSFIRKKQGVK